MHTPLTMGRVRWRRLTGTVSTLVVSATIAAGLIIGVAGPAMSPVSVPLASAPVASTTPAALGEAIDHHHGSMDDRGRR